MWLFILNTYRNEIEQFIYEICYRPMREAAYKFIYEHPYQLDLTYSRIKYPDNGLLEDMMLEYPTNIRISEDTLLFDAVVSCTVTLTVDGYRGMETAETSQWLVISCEAIVKDKLEKLTITEIKNYKIGKQRKTDGQAVSKNIVPILYKSDLDKEAEVFLARYYPEALERPTPVPIDTIAEQMGLEVIQGHRITDDFSIFGQICFSAGTADVYDIFKCNKSTIEVKRGTILIDAYTYWERNLGCVNNTIAHEAFHWYKHRMYASIKHILRGEKVIACRCPSNITYPEQDAEWSDEQIMEWQANSMAPRILMPISTFRQKVQELYKQYDYKNTPLKLAVLTCVADELASFYGVSRQSALIRMMETGFKEAASVYQYDSSATHHAYLSREDAFYAYSTNDELRELVDSGLFRFVDGYFVIDTPQYIEINDDGSLALTDYAWSHLSECTLQFSWKTIKKSYTHKHLPIEILHRANEDKKVSSFDASQNNAVISEATKKKREEFEKQNAMRKTMFGDKTCWEAMFEIIQTRGLSKPHFCSLTGLGEEVYRKAQKNIETKPNLRTIAAFSRGLDLNIQTTEKLLQLAGHAFDDSDEHQALKFCITGFSGMPIEDCNDFLESYGYEPLGSKQRL